MDLHSLASLTMGLSWTVAYISAICAGFRDQTYGMPVVALALNFAWEVIWAFETFSNPPNIQFYMYILCGLTDIGLVVCYFLFGRSEFGPYVTRPVFFTASVLLFAVAFAVQGAFVADLGAAANLTSSFLQNALMSWLFISMFFARGGTRGQTLTVAVSKCIGTVAPTILFGFIYSKSLVLVLGMICFVLDIFYIGLVACAQNGRTFKWHAVAKTPCEGNFKHNVR